MEGVRRQDKNKSIRTKIRNTDEDIVVGWINDLMEEKEDSDLLLEMCDETEVLKDVFESVRHKLNRPHIENIIGKDYVNIFDKKDNKVLKTIRTVQYMILSESFKPRKRKPITIMDRKGKQREIIIPIYQDEHVIHHSIIRVLMPELRKGLYDYSCASIPGRGVMFIKKKLEKILYIDKKNTKYVFQMDIHDCFNSVPRRRLKKSVKKLIHDKNVRRLMLRIVDTTHRGLPLGFYTSQWLLNYYLQPLDHYIKERILDDCAVNTKRTKRHGAVYYFRYLDDFLILGPSKKELHLMKNKIEEVLRKDFGLRIKPNWQIYKFDYFDKKDNRRKGRFIDFVGFRFYRKKTTIRRRTYKRMLRTIRRLAKKGTDCLSYSEAAALLSYYGLLTQCHAMKVYKEKMKPHFKVKALKRIIKREFEKRYGNQ